MKRILPWVALWLQLIAGAGAQISSVFTVEENGPRSKRINIVLLSEGYTAADMPNFATHVDNVRNFLFTKEPWQQYRSYCNVYRIEIASNQSGTDNGSAGGTRDTYFQSGFNTPSVTQLLTLTSTGNSRAINLLNTHVPEYDIALVIVNDTKYGGAGGGIATTSIHSSSPGIAEHEVGHSFANLADEYDTEYTLYTPSERINNTAQTVRSLIRWNVWIDAATPVPTPEISTYDSSAGLFEGSMYRTSGWYRPHNNSLMRNLFRPVGQVNREAFVLAFYSKISPIDASSPATTSRTITGFEDLSFSVTPKSPSSGLALGVIWQIDGVAVPGATSSTFTTTSDVLGNGSHSVTAVVRDPTTFVRNDPTNLLDDSVTWPFTLTNQLPTTLPGWRAAYGVDSESLSDDGLSNLMKYALRLDPLIRASSSERPASSFVSDGGNEYLTLTVPRASKRTDVIYRVEVSSDLSDWRSGPGYTVTIEDSSSLLVVRDTVPKGPLIPRFIRLTVALP